MVIKWVLSWVFVVSYRTVQLLNFCPTMTCKYTLLLMAVHLFILNVLRTHLVTKLILIICSAILSISKEKVSLGENAKHKVYATWWTRTYNMIDINKQHDKHEHDKHAQTTWWTYTNNMINTNMINTHKQHDKHAKNTCIIMKTKHVKLNKTSFLLD